MGSGLNGKQILIIHAEDFCGPACATVCRDEDTGLSGSAVTVALLAANESDSFAGQAISFGGGGVQ